MSIRRALVDCAVLCLQDTCLLYPCCKCCFSRVDLQRGTERWKCSKCGLSCLKERVDFRYRLSLRVTRNADIFGMTVFGSCLNPFFGVPAISLQRLVGELSGQNKADFQVRLLIQAVEDCFVGKHFIFGIKVPDGVVAGPLFAQAGSSKEPVNFIASQIALSNTAAPGCSVVNYYRALLQKAAAWGDPSTGPLPSPSPLRLHHPSATTFDSTLPASPLSQSLHDNNTLSPTPPWQRSLGVVTSSAEQEESCSVRSSGDDLTSKGGPSQSQQSLWDVPVWLSICGDGLSDVTEGSLPLSCYSTKEASQNGNDIRNVPLSLPGSPDSPVHLSGYCTPVLHEWPTPSEPENKRTIPSGSNVGGSERESDGEESNTLLSNSVVWEDMPFSESLGEFICDNSIESDKETLPNVMMKYIRENHFNASHGSPNLKSLSVKMDPQSSSTISQPKDLHLHRTLLDITNTGSTNSDSGQTLLTGNKISRDFSSNSETVSDLRDRSDVCISVGKRTKNEEQTGISELDDEYNCSADLFSNSQSSIIEPTQTPATNTDTCPQTNAKERHLNVRLSRDSEQSVYSHGLDFVPFSQSTPVAKKSPVHVEIGPLTHRDGIHRHFTPQRHVVTPRASKRTHRRLGPREHVLAQQCLKLQRRTPSRQPERDQNPPSLRETTASDSENSEMMVSPSDKNQRVVKPRVKSVTDSNVSKRTLLDRLPQSHHQSVPLDRPGADRVDIISSERTGECKDLSAGDVGLGPAFSHFLGDESGACDWSRDLFSDSF